MWGGGVHYREKPWARITLNLRTGSFGGVVEGGIRMPRGSTTRGEVTRENGRG